jgi:hypothetical protein
MRNKQHKVAGEGRRTTAISELSETERLTERVLPFGPSGFHWGLVPFLKEQCGARGLRGPLSNSQHEAGTGRRSIRATAHFSTPKRGAKGGTQSSESYAVWLLSRINFVRFGGLLLSSPSLSFVNPPTQKTTTSNLYGSVSTCQLMIRFLA